MLCQSESMHRCLDCPAAHQTLYKVSMDILQLTPNDAPVTAPSKYEGNTLIKKLTSIKRMHDTKVVPASEEEALVTLLKTPVVPHSPAVPAWITGLLNAELFQECTVHAGIRKNEGNYFCMHCTPQDGHGMCKHCLDSHAQTCQGTASSMFQVRRYMYQNVVHVRDIAPKYCVDGVQAYCINSQRAILIHPKPPPPSATAQPAFSNQCLGCAVPLRPDCSFCSLRCKIDVEFDLDPPTPGLSTAHPGRQPQSSRASGVSPSGSEATLSEFNDTRTKRRKFVPMRSHLI